MYHMEKASVRELRYNFQHVEGLLRNGQKVQITKRRRVIATLVPSETPKRPSRPDFLRRLQKLYGKRQLSITGAELIARERDRY